MANVLPPPPINDPSGSFQWMEWYRQLRNYISQSGSVPWSVIDFAGSNISDIAIRNHNNLQTLQGGSTGEYYHLTLANYNALVNKQVPTWNVGDVSGGNYLSIDSGGFLELKGTATVWDDLRVEPSIKTTGVNDPVFTQVRTNGAGSRGVYVYVFDDAVTASQKEVFFSVQLPHSWKGTVIYPHVHWMPLTAATNQRPVWGLEYTWADIGQTFGNTSIIYTNGLVPNDTNLTQYRHYVSTFPTITPTTSQDEISAVLICRLFRYSGDASDTYTGSCGILYTDFHFELDSMGSRTDFAK